MDSNKIDVKVNVAVTGQGGVTDLGQAAKDTSAVLQGDLAGAGQAAADALESLQGAADGKAVEQLGDAAADAGGNVEELASATGQAGRGVSELGGDAAQASGNVSALGDAAGEGASQAQALSGATANAGSDVADLGRQAADAQDDVNALASAEQKAGDEAKELSTDADKASDSVEDIGLKSKESSDGLEELARAVNAKTDALKASLTAERSEIAVLQEGLALQKTQQQTLLQVARAKGDEAAATQASNRLREIEAEQLDLVARGKRAEAAALQAATDARREALSAIGPLTVAQQKELETAENTAQALRTQAAAADESARRVRILGTEMEGAAKQGPNLQGTLTQVSKAIAGLFAVNKAWDFAKDTVALADAYGQMAERISMATPIASEYDLVQRRILESANLTYRPLAEQQELYIRTADALRSMGYATTDVLDITDSFSYLMTTNAASVERGASAIDAYTKAIQSGKVESDGWQSIMAATPTIVDAIATATNKTAAEVRQLGITGKLSIQDLNEGLRRTVDLNKEAASGMSATVKDAVTRLMNTWTTYVGEANRANQTTEKIASSIDLVSANLDTLISLAIKAGEVMVVVWAIRALTALKAYTAQLAVAAAETSALMATTTAAGAKMGAALAAAGKVAAAGWVGWEIGAYLRSEFEVVEKAGIALAGTVAHVANAVQTHWEITKAVFTDDTIANALERSAQRARQTQETFEQMWRDADRSATAQTASAAATDATAKAAANAATQWGSLSDTYKKVNEDLARQAELLQATAALRNAEASTAVDLARAFGTENEQRQAQAAAARIQAEQSRALAEQKTLELNLMRGEREALAAVGADLLALDPIKKKELEDLDHKIALRHADAAAAIEQARSSEIAAAQASAEAEAMRDNSARVEELSNAYDKARASLEAVRAAKIAGKATTDELAAAEQAAGRAALVYRDALNDQLLSIKAKADAEAGSRSVQEMSIRVAIEHQKAIYEVARARGDERTAMAAQNEIRRLEIELLKLSAEAKRAEAKAQLAAVEAQRAALLASGQLTEQKRLELDAITKAAKVKEMEAQISDITADKLAALADAAMQSGQAAGGSVGGYESAASGMRMMADAANIAVEAMGRLRSTGGLAAGEVVVNKDGSLTLMNASRSMSDGGGLAPGQVVHNKDGSLTLMNAGRTGSGVSSQFGDTREERLAGQNAVDNTLMFAIRDKLNAGTLSEADLASVRAVVASLKQNTIQNAQVDKHGAGFISLEGRRDDAAWRAVGSRLEDFIAQTERAASAGTATSSSGQTMNINISGRRYTATASDAQSASAIVAALEAAARDGGG